jgi:hypothetical protein
LPDLTSVEQELDEAETDQDQNQSDRHDERPVSIEEVTQQQPTAEHQDPKEDPSASHGWLLNALASSSTGDRMVA